MSGSGYSTDKKDAPKADEKKPAADPKAKDSADKK